LEATLRKSLRMARTLTLRGGKLLIESELENCGSRPVECGWGAALHLSLPDGAELAFQTRQGEKHVPWETLPGDPNRPVVLVGDQLPLGEWQVEMPGSTITHSFAIESGGRPIQRVSIGKAEAMHTLALDLRCETAVLEPGNRITAHQEIAIRAAI
jgi:hypothetical protein